MCKARVSGVITSPQAVGNSTSCFSFTAKDEPPIFATNALESGTQLIIALFRTLTYFLNRKLHGTYPTSPC